MKKELLDWIDRETDRLDRAEDGLEPEHDESDPVPETLRQVLAGTAPEDHPRKH
jgi:hypothetical protein